MRLWLLWVALAWLWPGLALAHVERFAIVAGNNTGVGSDAPLSYAAADATRVYDVLRELGGFQPANMVLLHDEDADTLRRSLITVNQRIRSAMSLPDTQVMLFVYYSGHADGEDLHLAGTRLSVAEFAQLVTGSAASFRLLVLDACRSGALTRAKGGKIKPAFPIPDEALPGDGVAFLTASAVSEDAQESEELRGSFFTHALVSGMLGAADDDRDGRVVLDEAYRYAYQSTLRATSRTASGIQHPTFRYDLRGQGDLVLTRPDAYAAKRASLSFPKGLGFLLMREHADGPVVAEVSERADNRTLSVRAGAYFVRGRGDDVLYEGPIEAAPGGATEVRVEQLNRIEYAKLVRKGKGVAQVAQALEVGGRVRSALPNADHPCVGGYLGYGLDFAQFGARARLSMCMSGFSNMDLQAHTNAYDLDARVHRAWDLDLVSIELGLGGGASLFTQQFDLRGDAPQRYSLVPFLLLGATASIDIHRGLYASLDLSAETHFLPLLRDTVERSVSFALRMSLGVGQRF
ncbi:MAG TPA: caspase family protein [Polyangiales bacterium]|nr:caspase family protein [Polyangiales bacterium]